MQLYLCSLVHRYHCYIVVSILNLTFIQDSSLVWYGIFYSPGRLLLYLSTVAITSYDINVQAFCVLPIELMYWATLKPPKCMGQRIASCLHHQPEILHTHFHLSQYIFVPIPISIHCGQVFKQILQILSVSYPVYVIIANL